MIRTKAEHNIVSFASFAERAAQRSGAGGLLSKARVAAVLEQKEAFLAELSGYVDEVLDNRALMIQRQTESSPSRAHRRPAPQLQLLQGGKK